MTKSTDNDISSPRNIDHDQNQQAVNYYIAIDIETTGFDAQVDDITEIAAVKFFIDGTVLDTFQELAKPACKIPKIVEKKTGITNSMVACARSPREVMSDLETWVGEPICFVAHNAPFDAKFIKANYDREHIPVPNWMIIDTLKWVRRKKLPISDNKLGTIANFLKVNTDNMHRALPDAHAVVALLIYLFGTVKDGKAAIKRRMVLVKEMAWEEPSAKQVRYLRNLGFDDSDLIGSDKEKASKSIDEKTMKGNRNRGSSTRSDRPATRKQLGYLRSLGAGDGEIEDLTVSEASDLISEYKKENPSGLSCDGCLIFVVVLVVLAFILLSC